jgi:excisionase family DNA binding protein
MIASETNLNETNGMTTVTEAAKILDVSPRRVLQFIAEKRLKAVRVSARLYLLNEADVRRFAKQPREAGNPALKKSTISG